MRKRDGWSSHSVQLFAGVRQFARTLRPVRRIAKDQLVGARAAEESGEGPLGDYGWSRVEASRIFKNSSKRVRSLLISLWSEVRIDIEGRVRVPMTESPSDRSHVNAGSQKSASPRSAEDHGGGRP